MDEVDQQQVRYYGISKTMTNVMFSSPSPNPIINNELECPKICKYLFLQFVLLWTGYKLIS